MPRFGVIFVLQSLSLIACGQSVPSFPSVRRHDIETYIMSGYGDGWEQCDDLIIPPAHPQVNGRNPSFVADIEILKQIDISSAFSHAHCLLLTAHANDVQTLSQIVQFGWTAVHHKRIGIVLKMESNVTLMMAGNTTKLPFIIGSELNNGSQQFLCPVIGSDQPIIQSTMCGKHYTSLAGKTVAVGAYGHWPWIHMGYMFGVDVMLLNLLEEKLKFKSKVELAPSFDAAFDQVQKG